MKLSDGTEVTAVRVLPQYVQRGVRWQAKTGKHAIGKVKAYHGGLGTTQYGNKAVATELLELVPSDVRELVTACAQKHRTAPILEFCNLPTVEKFRETVLCDLLAMVYRMRLDETGVPMHRLVMTRNGLAGERHSKRYISAKD